MTYDQYQQLYSAAKEQIASRVDKIQPRAGNGASVLGMGIAIEVPVVEEIIPQSEPLYFILRYYESGPRNDIDNASLTQIQFKYENGLSQYPFDDYGYPTGAEMAVVDTQYMTDAEGNPPSEYPVVSREIRLQFIELVDTAGPQTEPFANYGGGARPYFARHPFPVQVTLRQFRVPRQGAYRQDTLRTVVQELRRSPVSTDFIFYPDPDYIDYVILQKVVKI